MDGRQEIEIVVPVAPQLDLKGLWFKMPFSVVGANSF